MIKTKAVAPISIIKRWEKGFGPPQPSDNHHQPSLASLPSPFLPSLSFPLSTLFPSDSNFPTPLVIQGPLQPSDNHHQPSPTSSPSLPPFLSRFGLLHSSGHPRAFTTLRRPPPPPPLPSPSLALPSPSSLTLFLSLVLPFPSILCHVSLSLVQNDKGAQQIIPLAN